MTPRLRIWLRWTRGEAGGGGGQRRGGPVPVPRDPELQQGGGGGPVPRGPRELHPVAGDDAPVVFAAGQRPAGGGVGEVRGDGGDEPGPFPVPPGPLIQDAAGPAGSPPPRPRARLARARSRAWRRLASSAPSAADDLGRAPCFAWSW